MAGVTCPSCPRRNTPHQEGTKMVEWFLPPGTHWCNSPRPVSQEPWESKGTPWEVTSVTSHSTVIRPVSGQRSGLCPIKQLPQILVLWRDVGQVHKIWVRITTGDRGHSRLRAGGIPLTWPLVKPPGWGSVNLVPPRVLWRNGRNTFWSSAAKRSNEHRWVIVAPTPLFLKTWLTQTMGKGCTLHCNDWCGRTWTPGSSGSEFDDTLQITRNTSQVLPHYEMNVKKK